jgi:hypothetical protein
MWITESIAAVRRRVYRSMAAKSNVPASGLIEEKSGA